MRKLFCSIFFFCIICTACFAQDTWFIQYQNPSSLVLSDIFFVTSSEGYAVGAEGTLLKTTNNGNAWAALNSGTSEGLVSIQVIGSNIYVLTASNSFRKTSDGGATWTSSALNVTALTDMYFADENIGYVVGFNDGDVSSRVYRTADGGTSWSESKNLGLIIGTSIFGTSSSNVWVGGSWGNYYKWNGTTWESGNIGALDNVMGIYLLSSLEAWLASTKAASDNNLHHTTDGGTTWSHINVANGTQHLTNVRFIDQNHGWAVGYNGVIYATSNGGANNTDWTLQDSGLTEHLNCLFFTDINNGWTVGSTTPVILKYGTTTTTTTTSTTTTTTTTTTNTTTTTIPLVSTSAPQYPAGKQYWNPDSDSVLPMHFHAESASANATITMIQIGPPYSTFKRSISVAAGDNKTNISTTSDFGGSYPNGIYKVYIFDNATGARISKGLITIYR